MNIPTLIVIAIVAIGALFALRSLRKKSGGCACSNCNACIQGGNAQGCPGARKADAHAAEHAQGCPGTRRQRRSA